MRRMLGRLSVVVAIMFTIASVVIAADNPNYEEQRQRMVREQIENRGISDLRVLDAMRSVERHLFVPESSRYAAYEDTPLRIAAGQTISQPYIVAVMTELLHLDGDEKVLEIGTGSGYQAAILGELAAEVYTIEIVDVLAEASASLLNDLGYENITVRAGDGYKGWPEQAPFEAIIVTAAPAEVPEPLTDQLAEGGRMVIPVGEDRQELLLIEKKDSVLVATTQALVRFVPMTGEAETEK